MTIRIQERGQGMRSPIFIGSLLVGALILVTCSDASFNAGAGSGATGRNETCKKPPCNDDPKKFDPNDPKSILVRYGKDIKPSIADYLFVLDNSVSMVDEATRVSLGLTGITKDKFPESALLAVMTTMGSGNPTAAAPTPTTDTKKYTCIDKEPGFLSLVDRASVEAFKSCLGVPPAHAAKYQKMACESGWFKPFDVNANGERCFSAALQNPHSPVGCEPGILAVEQLLARNTGKPLFRDNAAVSIIFISDEQQDCELPMTRGNPLDGAGRADNLKRLIQENSKVASIKFHGIIPAPSNVPSHTLAYEKVISHVGGKAVPIADLAADYNSIMEEIITATVDNVAPEFIIPNSAKKVTSVEVSGVPTKQFQFDASRSKVTIPGLDPNKTVDIVIRFE